MAKVESIFGVYAEAKNLQAMIDASKARFNQPWFKKYFTWAPQTLSLKYSTAVGRSRIEAAASVVDSDAPAPLRSRANLEKYDGNVASIKEKLKMSQQNYRDFLTLQQLPVADAVKKTQLLDLLFNDVQIVGNAAMKRIDILTLQAVSKGEIDINISNNPDGIVTDTLDLFMPAANKKTVVKVWTDSTADAVADIDAVVVAAQDRGVSFAKILMPKALFIKFKNLSSTQNYLKAFYNPGGNAKYAVTLDNINEFLSANLYPMIELIDEVVGVEQDGVISTIRPFKAENVSFIPAGGLGVIHNALAIEALNPVKQVSYSNYERALISKWSDNDPFTEYTAVELNAFPGVEQIDNIFILKTDTAT